MIRPAIAVSVAVMVLLSPLLLHHHAAAATPEETREWTLMLEDENSSKRSSAAAFLLAAGNQETLSILLDALKPGRPEATRISVINAFGVKRDQRAVPQMLLALEDRSEAVREAARAAIERIHAPTAIIQMTRAAADTKRNPQTRIRVMTILGEMRAIDAVPTFIDLLSDGNESVRKAARASLKRVTLQEFETEAEWRDWWDKKRNLRREQILEEIVRLQSERLRRMSQRQEWLWLQLIGLRKENQNPDLLIKALRQSESVKVKLAAVQGLSALKGKPIVEAVCAALNDTNGPVREAAARALGAQSAAKPLAVPGLIKALRDPLAPVQAAAATALGQLKAARALDELVRMLKVPSPQVATAAAGALGQMADARAVPKLEEAAFNPQGTPELREASARALTRINAPKVGPILLRLLKSPEDKVRWVAVDALGGRRARQAVRPLCSIARKDKNPQIRQAALAALGNIGDAAALSTIVEALFDGEASVSKQAMLSLEQLAGTDPKRYASALATLINTRRFDMVEKVLAKAVEQFSQSPNHARDIASLRGQVAAGLMQTKEWGRAKTHLLTLVTQWPKEAAHSRKLAACLIELRDINAALAFLGQARRNIPEQTPHWCAESARVIALIAEKGDAKRVVAEVDALEKEVRDLGGAKAAAALRALRDQAEAKLAPPDKPAQPPAK